MAEPQILDEEMMQETVMGEEPIAKVEQVTETIETEVEQGITEDQLKQLLSSEISDSVLNSPFR